MRAVGREEDAAEKTWRSSLVVAQAEQNTNAPVGQPVQNQSNL